MTKFSLVLGLGATMTLCAATPSAAFVGSGAPLIGTPTPGIGVTDVHYRRAHPHWRHGWRGHGWRPYYGYRPAWRHRYHPYPYYPRHWGY